MKNSVLITAKELDSIVGGGNKNKLRTVGRGAFMSGGAILGYVFAGILYRNSCTGIEYVSSFISTKRRTSYDGYYSPSGTSWVSQNVQYDAEWAFKFVGGIATGACIGDALFTKLFGSD